jgi:type I restriction-modification system DNA methylase subunit
MPLSWNEIKSRAITFTNEWKNEAQEHAEAKSFWDAFFNVFGISRRRVATFEQSVKKLNNKQGFIDLFWSGTLLVEHKSKGKDLEKAYEQALDYFHGLKAHELPRYILVSDFERFRLFDLDKNTEHEFTIHEFVQNIHLFGFIAGYEQRIYQDQDPVNIKAAELMGKLHDRLKAVGYVGHDLEVYLVRLLFCLFAEDTGIFEKSIFQEYIELHTKEDGSDLAMHLAQIFQILDTPTEKRLTNVDENLHQFPYVNGLLFSENLRFAAFDSAMRENLLKACRLDWGGISPAIFGSMFQAAMDTQERRNLGAHFTSEKNIQKLIRPLFLNELYAEFEKAKISTPKLQEFHQKLGTLKFFDPACGSGNFLIITYRELRELEIKVLEELLFIKQKMRREVAANAGINVASLIKVNVNQFYGIEIEEFASQIAQVGMWLIDHQMNLKVSEIFGQYFARLPLQQSATIVHGNSLHLDWSSFMDVAKDKTMESKKVNIIKVDELPKNRYTEKVNSPKELQEAIERYGTINIITTEVNYIQPTLQEGFVEYDYILGNPPFYGSKLQSQAQRNDLAYVFGNVKNAKVMDYVSAWYIKAAKFIKGTKTKVAFVSTNSVNQGEQVGVLWGEMLNKYGVKIHFAHRTFKWSNEAKGNAAVYVVIVGFANFDTNNKRIFDYEDIKGEPTEIKAKNINPYLVDAPDLVILSRTTPIANVPKMSFGNMPLDGGNLLLSDEEKTALIQKEPQLEKFIKPLISAREFLNGQKRWCFWLVGVSPKEIRASAEIMRRVEAVKQFRLESVAPSTQKHAITPTLFRDRNNPETFIVVPRVSSENRKYIPMGFFDKNSIVSDTCMSIPNADLFHFGILTSLMHISWVKYTCGRLKSDFRYSKNVVYNNYPFPKEVSEKNREKVEKAAQKVLDVRAEFTESSLADLYDPLAMPLKLIKAHQALDKAVDLCYRSQIFGDERSRIEFLFDLYEQYTAPLMVIDKKGKYKK